MALSNFPPPGAPAVTGPGGNLITSPTAGLQDAAAGQFGGPTRNPMLTTRFQPTQQGASAVTPGTQNTEQVINPLQQITQQVNSESVLGVILAVAALVLLYRLAHH